jgi:hypothetical protein
MTVDPEWRMYSGYRSFQILKSDHLSSPWDLQHSAMSSMRISTSLPLPRATPMLHLSLSFYIDWWDWAKATLESSMRRLSRIILSWYTSCWTVNTVNLNLENYKLTLTPRNPRFWLPAEHRDRYLENVHYDRRGQIRTNSGRDP